MVPQKQVQEMSNDPSRNISTEENKKYTIKNKVDSAEISSSYSGSFEDKRISVAKSAILYDVTVSSSEKRIAELKKAVEQGTYNVPSNLIADSILK
jgi:anti-sigma28 factor (negative regulator of flagellin synthesis)